jgi:hypothetical protein
MPATGINATGTIEIRPGQGSIVESETVIDHNLFVNCNEESESPIGIKGSNVTIEGNTIIGGKRISLRHGHGCIVKNNWLNGAINIRVRGANHQILGNHLIGGTAIALTTGDTFQGPFEDAIPPIPDDNQPCAEDTLVVGNTGTGPIQVGVLEFADNTIPATDTTLWDNDNPVTFPSGAAGHTGTTTTVNPGLGNVGTATQLTTADVGMTTSNGGCPGEPFW